MESNIALNCLLPEISKHKFNFYLSEKVGASKHEVPALQYLDYLEREFITTRLFPKIEQASAKGFLSFKQISQKYGTDLRLLSEITADSTLSEINAFQPDLFISIRFGKIFKGKILSIPPKGIINLHSAILPDFKGVLGTFRAFMHDQQTIGSTIHYINDSSIDTGAILEINTLQVQPGKSVLWHVVNLYPTAVSTLNNIINQLANGGQPKSSTQPNRGNYYSFPGEKDFASLKEKGIQIYNQKEYAELLSVFYGIDKQWILTQLHESRLPASY